MKQSKHISNVNLTANKISTNKSQKENDPSTQEQLENKQKQQEYKDPNLLKTVKISVVNDYNNENVISHPRLSVQVDITNNRKTIKVPKTVTRNRTVVQETEDINTDTCNSKTENSNNFKEDDECNHVTEDRGGTGYGTKPNTIHEKTEDVNDYKFPLEALNNKK